MAVVISWLFKFHMQGDDLLLLHQGEPLTDSVVRKAKESTVLAWHPTRKVLAVGWETGEITARSEQENEAYEFSTVHKSEITILQWTSNGSRLISADAVRCCN